MGYSWNEMWYIINNMSWLCPKTEGKPTKIRPCNWPYDVIFATGIFGYPKNGSIAIWKYVVFNGHCHIFGARSKMRMMMKWSWGSCGGNSLMERSMGIAPLGNTWKNGGFLNCGDQAQIIQLRYDPPDELCSNITKRRFLVLPSTKYTPGKFHSLPQIPDSLGWFASKDNSKEGMHQKWMQTLKKRKQKNVDSSVQRGSQSRCVLEVFINFTSGPSQISSSGLRCVCFHVMQEPIVKKTIRLLRKTPLWTEKFRVFNNNYYY